MKTRIRIPALGVILAVLCLSGEPALARTSGVGRVAAGQTAGSRPPDAIDLSALDESLKAEMASSGAPASACAVLLDGKVIYRKAFGLRSVETSAPAAPDDLFRIGSTTKMFVAAAILTAAARGIVRLDAPIGDIAPELHPSLARLTLSQLLSHTSGLADDAPMSGPLDESSLARRVKAWDETAFFTEPGKIMSYANTGYVLAGYVLERAMAKPFADAMTALLFEPLGMNKSTFRPLSAVTYPFALGHQKGSEGVFVVRPFPEHAGNYPPGSLFTNIDEISLFLTALLENGAADAKSVLPPGLFARMAAPHAAIPALGRSYGYGLVLLRERGLDTVMHAGARAGYGSVFYMIPEKKFAVIILANTTGATFFNSARKAAELVVPAGAFETRAEPENVRPVSPAELEAWAGRYANGKLGVELESKDGRLWVRMGSKAIPIERVGDLTFRAPGAGELSRFVLVPGEGGRIEYLAAEYWALRRK